MKRMPVLLLATSILFMAGPAQAFTESEKVRPLVQAAITLIQATQEAAQVQFQFVRLC
jgi:hypothetical protein